MSTSFEGSLREFHEKLYGPEKGHLYNSSLVVSRLRLMMEELGELAIAMHQKDLVQTADAIADLIYVVVGTGEILGIPVEECFREVHRSNLTKEFDRVSLGEKGARKGPGYEPPDLAPILRRAGLVP